MLCVHARVGPSTIHGLGLFAAQFIPEGTVIWAFASGFDVEIAESSVDSLSPAAREQLLHYAEYYPTEKKFVLSSDDDRFTNHSDTPNTAPQGEMVVAARDIHDGEEITCDYRRIVMVGFCP
jgi:hypothetical protein